MKKPTHKDQLTILVAEDSSVIMVMIRSIIRRSFPGTTIIEATNGKHAVECFKSAKPDLIFMDIEMPGMDGFRAISEIRTLEKKFRTPVIILSAGALQKESNSLRDIGVDDFLTKPVSPEAIRKIILKWLDHTS